MSGPLFALLGKIDRRRGFEHLTRKAVSALGAPVGETAYARAKANDGELSAQAAALRQPIYRCSSDPKLPRNGGGAFAHRLQLANCIRVDLGFPSLVRASRLSARDSLDLPFFTEVRLEFGEDAEHVEKSLTGGGCRIDRLVGRLQLNAFSFQGSHDVLKIGD
jgi:hypothetical protein